MLYWHTDLNSKLYFEVYYTHTVLRLVPLE